MPWGTQEDQEPFIAYKPQGSVAHEDLINFDQVDLEQLALQSGL